MGDVKRYTYRYSEIDGNLHRVEEPDGHYVLHSDYAALLARHNALVEAVRDARFAEKQLAECWTSERERALQSCRAEVDRLIANESAADCKGEG